MVSDQAGAGLAWSATFNGEQDVYFVRVGDCNANGLHDSTDLSLGTSPDANTNGIPDECEPDCNANGVPDDSDIALGSSQDCNGNGSPDECDIATGQDCNGDGVLDSCDVTYDLESNQGFVGGASGDSASAGVWVRVDPVGTAAAPEDDHTPGPGTDCYVTGEFTDVANGRTTLTSPDLDLSGTTDGWVGYWRWYSNSTSGNPGLDKFVIDASGDGGQNWANVETIGPTGLGTGGGWFFHLFRVADVVGSANQVRLRFVASDFITPTVVEAAIDDLVVIDCAACAVSAPGEVDNLRVGISGTTASLTWSAESLAANYGVYRASQRDAADLECLVSQVAGTSVLDDGTLPPLGEAYYFVATASNCAGESTLGSGRTPSGPCP